MQPTANPLTLHTSAWIKLRLALEGVEPCPEKLEPLKDALFEAKVSGMTISQVQGCGSQHGWKEYYRGTEVLLNMVPKVKFEIICDDAEVDALIDVISATARTGNVGDGKIFVFPVDEVVRIRTGERGDEAI